MSVQTTLATARNSLPPGTFQPSQTSTDANHHTSVVWTVLALTSQNAAIYELYGGVPRTLRGRYVLCPEIMMTA